MKLRVEAASLIIIGLSVLGSWAWNELTAEPVCPVHELHDGKVVEIPYLCKDVLPAKVI